MERIVVFHTGAIGDTVMVSPAVAALRSRHAGARVEGVGYRERLSLLAGSGLLDSVSSIDVPWISELFAYDERPGGDAVAFFRGVDLVVSWISDVQGNFLRGVRAAGAREVVVGEAFAPAGSGRHAVDHYANCLRPLGIDVPEGIVPRLSASGEAKAAVADEVSRLRGGGRFLVAMLPGSGSAKKNWARERFAETAQRLGDEVGASVVVFLGPAEIERGEGDYWDGLDFPVLAERPLVEVAAIQSHLDCYLGCDSGLSHLAAALGRPVVTLFGPSDPTMWGPRGANVRIIESEGGGGLSGIGVDVVTATVGELLGSGGSCAPGEGRRR